MIFDLVTPVTKLLPSSEIKISLLRKAQIETSCDIRVLQTELVSQHYLC